MGHSICCWCCYTRFMLWMTPEEVCALWPDPEMPAHAREAAERRAARMRPPYVLPSLNLPQHSYPYTYAGTTVWR